MKQQPLICSKFYRLFEKKPTMKVDPKTIVVLQGKQYVKFPFEAIYVNEQVVLYFMIEPKEQQNKPIPEFQYVRVEISIMHNIKKQIIHSVKQTTRTLKKDSPHLMPFMFKVSEEGEYLIRTTTSYKEKQFITSQNSSGVQQKEETAVMRLQINKIFGIKEKVVYIEKEKLISYPLLVQYSVENLTNKARSFKADFVSEKFAVENLDPRQAYQMNGLEIENLVFKLEPKDIQSLFQTTKLGYFRIFWEKDGKEQKPLLIKFQQIVKLKCISLTKSIPKKDIHTVKIKIEKKLHFEYPTVQLSIEDLKQQSNPSIKILNMNKNKISLIDRNFDQVELSVVGLASGCHLLKGLKLKTVDGEDLPYENQIIVMIMNQMEEKQEKKLFEMTDVFDVFDQPDLLQ